MIPKQEAIGDAIEIKVPIEVMQFVLSKIRMKPKSIGRRILKSELLVNKWIDGSADEYDLELQIWELKILASLTHKYNWAVFLLEPANLIKLKS